MKMMTIMNYGGIGLIAALAGCGGGGYSSSTPVAPGTELAAVVMSGAQEVPAVSSTGTGSATVTVSSDRSRVDFNVSFSGFPPTTTTTISHIHIGHPGESGPVILNLALAPFASPLTGTATAADFVAQPARGINTFADAVNAILAGNTYINVHTLGNPGGEIRGALGPVSLNATLTEANEVTPPPVPTGGSGTASARLDNLQTNLVFNISFTALSSVDVSASHIHLGAVGVSGPIMVNFPLTTFTSPLTGTATAADMASPPPAGITTFTDAINAILSGNAYINVHTTANPGGQIRGQLIGVNAP